MEISADYASPNMRWALLIEDHPGADHTFREGLASEVGVPKEFGGDKPVVICTIEFPAEANLKPAVGYKEITDTKKREIPRTEWTPALWHLLCTKALGRACKRAGYPDKMPELKALMLWRRRAAEMEALAAGLPTAEPLPPEAVDQALDAAATVDDEAEVEEVPEGPTDPEGSLVDDDRMAELRRAVGGLGRRQGEVVSWSKEVDIPWPKRLTEAQADAVAAKIAEVAETEPAA